MATVADLPPGPLIRIIEPVAEAQGFEGRRILSNAEEAFQHWSERAEYLLVASDDVIPDDLSYDPVPFERAFTARVRYSDVGEMKPRQISDDELR
jgi:hypothetical protein